ncbi:unnamed protein product [Protopolystoma xenopodis]|uniref:Uncharacterized protein n=1 Tax=Protopolystoma xenopodis TaxID=117903 RepID=A0A3S5FE85_9PLAT|nr:unnamed protein product [Protopolystoma xenopodis]
MKIQLIFSHRQPKNPNLKCAYDDHEDARVTQIAVSPESSVQFSLVGLAMSSGHVFVHRLSDGQSLFTCPRLPSSLIDGRLCPRIVVLQFLYPHHILPESNIQENKGQRQRLSILYTNGRLKEWTFPMYPIESAANNNAIDATVETSPPLTKSSKKSRHTPATTDQLHESDTDGMNIENIGLPEINSWLEDFFNQQSKYWHRIGTLHSMAYLSDSSWLLATESRIFILRMDQPYFEDTVALALGRKKSNTRSNDSLKMVIHHSGIIQCDVISPGEIAVVRVEPGSVLSKLPPPLYKKRFGF